jgi:hypothetical protein
MTRAATLPPKAQDLLVKFAWMLSSPNEAERAIAALKFAELLKAHDLTPEDVLRPQPAQSVVPPASPAPPQPRDWVAVAEDILLTRFGALHTREQEFLPSLLARGIAPSIAQANWLIRIMRRTRVAPWTIRPWSTDPGDTSPWDVPPWGPVS